MSSGDYMSFLRQENGIWVQKKEIKGARPEYQQMILKCLNAIDPLFSKAQEKSDFDFILTLLGFRGIQSPGEDRFATLRQIFEGYTKIKRKFDHDKKVVLSLWSIIIKIVKNAHNV